MIEVSVKYVNLIKHTKDVNIDYFVYTDIEVKGHAEHTGYTNNTKVCAGVSACCYGIMRLITENIYKSTIKSGYFHVWTERTACFKNFDKESVYALNTLVCQLYELYLAYPKAFKKFDLIDVKENYDYERINSTSTKQHRFREGRKKHMGIYPIDEE